MRMSFIRILLLSCFLLECDNDGLTTYEFMDWCKPGALDVPIDFGDPLTSHNAIQVEMGSDYPSGMDCAISVIPQARRGISLTFLWLNLPRNNTSCLDYVQINTISNSGPPLCRFHSLPPGGKLFFSKAIDVRVMSFCQNCNKLRENYGFLITLKSAMPEARPTIPPESIEEDSATLDVNPPSSSPTTPTHPIPRFRTVPTSTIRPPSTSSVALYSTLTLVGILVAFAGICVIVGYCQSSNSTETEARQRRIHDNNDRTVAVTSFSNSFLHARSALRPHVPRIVVTSPDRGSRHRSLSPLRQMLERHSPNSHWSRLTGSQHREHPPPYTESDESNSENETRDLNRRRDNPRNSTVRFQTNRDSESNNSNNSATAPTVVSVGTSSTNAIPMTTTTAEINIPQRSSSTGSAVPNISPPCYACVENHSPVCFHQTSMPAGAPGPSDQMGPVRSTHTRIKSI